MPITKLKEYLDSQHVKYTIISHSRAYTAQEVAASAHIPGKEMAKTVIVKVDGKLAMAVLPASYSVNFDLLKRTVGALNIELATEREFKDVFPDCDIGAMPPFGNLYNIDVYASEKLAEDEEIAFNACNHTDLVKMRYADFERIVKPKVVEFSYI
ncbi:MAG: YbaK/EbsC family protein [candidate division Zixibacteria bacterium]|nr:YbaK/EbsC family protein [candidate division Zixibacteria bacterium]